MGEQKTVDILPYVCLAFAYNKKAHPIIDKIFDSDRETFHYYASNSVYYNSCPIVETTPLQIEYARKVLGILQCYLNTDSEEQRAKLHQQIDELFKKSFSYHYQLIKSSPKIDLDKFTKKIYEDMFKGFAWTGILNSDMHLFVVLFGCKFLNKEIVENEAYSFIISHLFMRQRHDQGGEYRITPQELEKYAKEGKMLKNKLELHNPDLRNCEFVGKNKEFIESLFAFMCDIENVSMLDILEETMDRKQVEEIYAFVSMIRKFFDKENETQEGLKEASENFISMLYFRAMLREYNKLKQYYLENAEAVYEKEKLQRRVADLEGQVRKLNAERSFLLSQQEHLMNNISKLQQELQRYNEDLQELYRLREIIFKENVGTEEPKIQELDVSVLKNKKIIVIGGLNEWINGLKEYLDDNSIFLDAKRLNYDENTVFANADLVIFNTKYLSHSAYYKAINQVKKNKIPYVYINNSNINQTLEVIVENLKGSR